MPQSKDQTVENVSFSLFGANFTLSVPGSQTEALKNSVAAIQSKGSRLMRENPSLTPGQAALLIAIEAQSRLQNFLDNPTLFESEAHARIERARRSLERGLKGDGK